MVTRAAVFVWAALIVTACERAELPAQPTAITPSSLNVTGTVIEKYPDGSSGSIVAGARVDVVAKPGVVASTTTDTSGQYRIEVGGAFDLKISKDGYESATRHVEPSDQTQTVNVSLPLVPRTLSGRVTETPPTESTPIGAAVVEIVAGPSVLQGTRTTTDANGEYKIEGLWGSVDVAVSKSGFEAKRARGSLDSSVTQLDLALLPDAVPARTNFTGRICADWEYYAGFPPYPGYGCSPDYPVQNHHYIPIHRAGRIEVRFTWQYQEDYNTESFWLELRCPGRVSQQYALGWSDVYYGRPPRLIPGGEPFLQTTTPGSVVCEIKPFAYASFKGRVAWTEYHLEVVHPK
jgi:Carboxypeptidase regulatory-like domain